MKLQGKNLSLQARRALNSATIEWLRENESRISDDVLVAELFSPLKSGVLVLLRTRLRAHLAEYRVYDKDLPKKCVIQHEDVVLGPGAEWKCLSYPMVGAAMGQCHSTGIKASKKAMAG